MLLKKEDHVVSVIMMTNVADTIYYISQCQNKSCCGFGHKSKTCPFLAGIPLESLRAEDIISSLVTIGFEPVPYTSALYVG